MGEIAAEFTGLADSNVFSSLNVLLSYNWGMEEIVEEEGECASLKWRGKWLLAYPGGTVIRRCDEVGLVPREGDGVHLSLVVRDCVQELSALYLVSKVEERSEHKPLWCV
jgi:hypothetical protein